MWASTRLARVSAAREAACPISRHQPKISTKSVGESVDKITDHLVGSFVMQHRRVQNRSAYVKSRAPAY